jgi:hypothetical protein
LPSRAQGRDPLARAAHTQRVGRIMIAIAVITCLGTIGPVPELVDRLLPGTLLLWLAGIWLFAIIGVAVAVERRPDRDDRQEWRNPAP